ncbi:MAG: hypothetical protein WD934_03840 [Gemmatimonadales bacterium]
MRREDRRTPNAKLEGRVDGFDARFDSLERRFDTVDHRFDAVDRRFERVEQRIDALDAKVDHRINALDGKVDGFRIELAGAIAALDSKTSSQFRWLIGTQLAVFVAIIAALTGALYR